MGYTGPVIEAVDLTKRYGPFVALDRLSLAVGPVVGRVPGAGAEVETAVAESAVRFRTDRSDAELAGQEAAD